GADAVLVYDGALAIAANTFPASGAWGKLAQFQKKFVYKGGDLCVTICHREFSSDGGDPELPTVASSVGRSSTQTSFDAENAGIFGGRSIALKLGFIPSVMTPNNLATAEGLGSWDTPFVASYVVQTIIAGSQLQAIDVGSVITGVSFRHSSSGNGGTFPTAET